MKTIEEFLGEQTIDVDLVYCYQDDYTFSQFQDAVLDSIREREMIYYGRAMEFLTEYDPSLQDSMNLASELGYTTDSLNSELLATLLLQDMLTQEWYEIADEIEEYFEEYEEWLEEQEEEE